MSEESRYKKTCVQCGKTFPSTRAHARYCSSNCRAKATRARQKEEARQQALAAFLALDEFQTLQAASPDAAAYVQQLADQIDPETARLALNACLLVAP